MARILIIDDEPGILEVISTTCLRHGHQIFPFSNSEAALKELAAIRPHLVIVDVKLDKKAGFDILRESQNIFPNNTVVLVTTYASVATAVDAMKIGAYDYLTKPFKIDILEQCIQRALDYQLALDENGFAKSDFQNSPKLENLIGSGARMQKIYRVVEKIADTDCTVLINGERGTGKALIAQSLHYNSSRQNHAFVSINCGGLSDELLEAELFGQVRGAFAGGFAEKIGLFEEAHDGTLFLNEIHLMSLQLQAKLLRVLQEREIRRLGRPNSLQVNVRVIAASDEDIKTRIRNGTFREDLFYRLAVIPIDLPPLRERLEDVPLLVEYFLQKYARHTSTALKRVEPQLMERLTHYLWPGNTSELENVIERACALSENGAIRIDEFPTLIQSEPRGSEGTPPVPWQVGKSLDEFVRYQEQKYIEMTLKFNQGSREKTASMLGISIATLYRKLDLKHHRQ